MTTVAAWDVPLLRGAVVTLAAVEARLAAWRSRLGAVARSLDSPGCWSGQAGRSATATVFDLDAVAAVVHAGLAESLTSFRRLAADADAAQERAATALALARAADVQLGTGLAAHRQLTGSMRALVPAVSAPGPEPALAAAEEALVHADAAAAAATAAGAALDGLGVQDAFTPADFWELAAEIQLVGPVRPPQVPVVGTAPPAVADWWSGLSAGQQSVALRAAPTAIGALDGLPAWARDRANRILLDRALRDRHGTAEEAAAARAVADRIAIEEAAGRSVQLHLLDLDDDQVVLSIGDLDTADAVSLMVPGVFNTPADDLDGLVADAGRVRRAAQAAGPALQMATVVWLGYSTPSNPLEAITRFSAWRGGPALSRALDGLVAARQSAGAPLPRTSVLAHSYGTVVLDEAADEPGRLAADAVVLLGSPGMEPTGAAGLEAPEVFDAAAVGDVISWSGVFGMPTWSPRFGSTGLPGDVWMGHSAYYDPAHSTLAAIGEVVAGTHAG